MRVLIAGATGVIGRPMVSRLRSRGHTVSAMVRDASRAHGLDAHEVVVADGLDDRALRSAVAVARPDVVVHQMTALRQMGSPDGDAVTLTARLRTHGTATLIDA